MFRWLLPVLPLVACVGLLFHPLELPPLLADALPWLPVLLASCTLLLGYYFHGARLGIGALLLLLLQLGPEVSNLTYACLGLLALVAAGKERGLLSVHGLLRFAFCVAVLAYVYMGQQDWPLPDNIDLKLVVSALAALALLIVLLRRDLAGFMLLLTGACLWYYPESLWFSASQLSLLLTLLVNTYSMAFVDQLTGIPGRRALEGRLSSLGRRYCVAMLDVDHFKKFNDTWGHDVGDQVLKLVAKKVSQVSSGGQAFRYGGEEFAIIFSRRNSERVLDSLEQVRESIETYPLRIRSQDRPQQGKQGRGKTPAKNGRKTVQITISIGVAERNRDRKKPSDVIKAADQALYKAKKAGRNCVISAD